MTLMPGFARLRCTPKRVCDVSIIPVRRMRSQSLRIHCSPPITIRTALQARTVVPHKRPRFSNIRTPPSSFIPTGSARPSARPFRTSLLTISGKEYYSRHTTSNNAIHGALSTPEKATFRPSLMNLTVPSGTVSKWKYSS